MNLPFPEFVMKNVRQLCLGLILMSMGAIFPVAAYANEAVDTAEVGQPARPAVSRAEPLNIEERLTQSGDEALTYEHTFIGHENEIIVAYWNTEDASNYGVTFALYDQEGQPVPDMYYPNDISINELDGRNIAYQLPSTGEYQFVFTVPAELSGENKETIDYLLRLRVASFYERAMMMAIERLEEERFEESRTGFELAIAQRPESVMPYFGRLLTVGLAALESTGMTEWEVLTLEGMEQLFQSLDADEQALVLSDMQQITQNFMTAVESGAVEADALDFEIALLDDVASYLKTGEASEALREAME